MKAATAVTWHAICTRADLVAGSGVCALVGKEQVALFYLRSRGVPLKQAQSMMVLAFLAEAISEIEDEDIAEDIRQRLESWLQRHEH